MTAIVIALATTCLDADGLRVMYYPHRLGISRSSASHETPSRECSAAEAPHAGSRRLSLFQAEAKPQILRLSIPLAAKFAIPSINQVPAEQEPR
jgi:hypothetical protein